MKFSSINRVVPLSRKEILQGLIFIPVLLVSLYFAFSFDLSDKSELIFLIILITAICMAVIVFHSTKTWIPILICLMLLRDFSLGGLMGGGGLKIGDIFIVFIFFVWMSNNLFLKNFTKFIKSKLDLTIVLFLLFYIFSLFWSTDFEYGLVRILKLIRNFLFYIIIRELFIRDFQGSYKKATLSYIVTAIALLVVHLSIVISAGGFSDFLSLSQKETLTSVDMGGLRVRGTGGGVLITGPSAWLIITGIFVFGSIMITKSKIQKSIKILLVIFMFLAATVMTLSRTPLAIVGIILAVLFWGSLKLRLRQNINALLLILTIFTTTGIAFGFTQIYSKRLENMFEDHSWIERTDLYQVTTDAFLHSPLWGIGVGSNFSWQEQYEGINPTRVVHNVPLLILSETGLLGFIIFVVIIGLWLKYLWVSMHHQNGEPYIQGICLVMFSFTIGYIVVSLTVGEFEDFESWLVMGIASAIKNLHTLPTAMSKPISGLELPAKY